MGKTYKIVLGIFLLLVLLLTYLEASKPAPINWAPSYSAKDKIPLGGYVLYESLKNQEFNLKIIKKPPYEFLSGNSPEGTYFFLNDQLLFDDAELEKLLTWVSSGNTAFLASDAFGKNLLDTLSLNVGTAIPTDGVSSKPMFNLVQPGFKSEKAYLLDHEVYHSVFIEIDTAKHTVLGVSQLYLDSLKITNPEINYIKIPFGKGQIYMHTSPKTFSNYFMLNGNNFEYVEKALAYLPSEEIFYWDQYYKAGKSYYTSPLYILFKHNALKWAYYFVIFGSVLFIIFEGKRKQRSIPIRKPLQNQTFEFTRTVSGLYFEKKEFGNIANKKIALFLEYIRTKLRVSTSEINEEFYQKLASLSSNSVKEVKELFLLMQKIQDQKEIDKNELLELNSAINAFKYKNNGT